MLTFNVTTAGQSLLNAATPGSNPVLIDSIVLSGTGSFSSVSPVTNFAGAVVAADSDVGDYVVVVFDDTVTNNSYTIQQISLKSGNTVLANSEAVSITKVSGKPACFRISCQFAGASKCAFQNTNINIPYASKTRDGVIRLAVSSDETHKDRTVYSAADVEALIAAGVDGSNKYVPWDLDTSGGPIEGSTTVRQLKFTDDYSDLPNSHTSTVSLYYDTQEDETYLYFNNYIGGAAVSSSPAVTQSGVTGSPAIVTENYISELYSNSVVETTTSTPTNKLVSGAAVDTYVTNKLSSVDGNYVHIAGAETVTGEKTFSAAAVFSTSVSSPSYIGTGVYSTYAANTWSNSSNNAKLPTVAAVRSAIGAAETSITNAYQTADSGLQSQIDALNAGQNLADIVATKSALDTLSITNLQAGDKVQVLADETHDGASTVYNLTSTNPKTWTYIGKYGQDSYTKSEADNLFVENSQIKQSVDSTKQDEIPSSSAVASYVSTAISTASGDYVKLSSQTAQNITSDLSITGDVDITGSIDVDKISIDNNSITAIDLVDCGGNIHGWSIGATDLDCAQFDVGNGSSGIGIASHSPDYYFKVWDSYGDTLRIDLVASGTDRYHNCSGTAVADYQDAGMQAAVDGRLVTVDYLSSYTGDMSAYVKKTSSTVQNISSDLDITGDVDITGSLGVDNVLIDSTSVTTSWVACGGQTFSGHVGSSGGYSYGLSLNSGYSNTTIELTFRDLGTPSAELSVGSNNIEFYSSNSSPVVRGSYVADYNDFSGASLEDGRLTTVDYVKNSIKDISSENAIGSMGLFLYTEVGNQKSYGEFVNGAYLKPVGMSLPISGQISYKAVATNEALSGKWKLLSVAMRRTATEPCLVLAQKVADTY